MAQDVKAEECPDRKWDVIHIPDELQKASTTGMTVHSLRLLVGFYGAGGLILVHREFAL